MSNKHKIIFAALVPGLIILLFSSIYAEKGLIDLLRLREEKSFLMIENSKIGLKLIDDIYTFKRLAKNDLKLIDHLARKQGMVGKDEMVLIPREPIKEPTKANPKTQSPGNFRRLTDDEIEEILKFDIKSFKFYEELKENDQDKFAPNKKESDTPPPESNGKISGSPGYVTIQVAAFKDRKHANRLVKKLKKKGYQAYIVTGKNSENVTWHRVRIGNIRNENDALTIIGRLKKDKLEPIIVRN